MVASMLGMRRRPQVQRPLVHSNSRGKLRELREFVEDGPWQNVIDEGLGRLVVGGDVAGGTVLQVGGGADGRAETFVAG